MNDRYLFKAKRIDNGEWIVGNLLIIANVNFFICTGKIKLDEALKGHIYPEMYAVAESTICQCTELKDKEGNFIWENDILKVIYSNEIGEVKCIEKFVFTDKRRSHIMEWLESSNELEVRGNIFDNPELLEVEERR